jgi:hypothetical protein
MSKNNKNLKVLTTWFKVANYLPIGKGHEFNPRYYKKGLKRLPLQQYHITLQKQLKQQQIPKTPTTPTISTILSLWVSDHCLQSCQ